MCFELPLFLEECKGILINNIELPEFYKVLVWFCASLKFYDTEWITPIIKSDGGQGQDLVMKPSQLFFVKKWCDKLSPSNA